MPLLEERLGYKPFEYPWAYNAWLTQQSIHWMPNEVPLADDVKDWEKRLSPAERNLLTQIFRFFTQADVEVNNCYMKHYARIFKPVEVQMMLAAFANTETIHIAAYSHLLDTIGMPEAEYGAFLKYKAMKDKHDYLQGFDPHSAFDIARTLAVFGGFTEGMQLFSSFAVLLNFQRFRKMRGMGQIITWSVRDETLHTMSIIRLFHTFLSENPSVWNDHFREVVREDCRVMVGHEDAFVEQAFAMGGVEGMSAGDVKAYIRHIADVRLGQLGLESLYGAPENPLPWMDDLLGGMEHTNFFENRATEYSRGATSGTWGQVFE